MPKSIRYLGPKAVCFRVVRLCVRAAPNVRACVPRAEALFHWLAAYF